MSFAQFPEQTRAIELLQRSLQQDRLAHGYLFSGSALEELEGVARTLAKTLNCQAPRKHAATVPPDSCDKCDSCVRIDESNHPDVLWIRPESKSRIISIEQIRELMQTVNLKPTIAEYKVGVIVCADRLNVQAANAFLKTLEEPPSKSILILLTTEPQKILETILSRCLRLSFVGSEARFTAEQTEWLADFSRVAASTESGLLARYRLLGVLLKKFGEKREQIEETLSANSPLEKYDDLDTKTREKMEDELAAAVEAEYRRQRAEFLSVLHWWLRDVWLQTLALGQEMLSFPNLAPASAAIGKRRSAAEAMENLQVIDRLQRQLNSNVQEALALEVSLLKLKL